MTRLLAAAALGIAVFCASPAAAAEYRIGDLRVESPWARATPGHAANGAAYMTIVNEGDEPDRLVAASTRAAARAALHGHRMAGGVMEMHALEAVEVPPGASVVLAPGGPHLMLMGLAAPLAEGTGVPLTLVFERAGALEVEAVVEPPGAMGPGR